MDDVTIYAAAKFLSTPSARRATTALTAARTTVEFLSTPSARRATWQLLRLPDHRSISIHALREEGDHRLRPFNALRFLFLSTPSARRATFGVHPVASLVGISIHALREEGDCSWKRNIRHIQRFLSTPSARRATPRLYRSTANTGYFYPRPPRGGRLRVLQAQNQTERISIHALREEGDRWPRLPTTASGYFYPRPPRGGRPSAAATVSITMPFLSTPSARRATPDPAGAVVSDQFLSTPSARRATSRSSFRSRPAAYFYPRPPRGGRRQLIFHTLMNRCNFYPRPPRGGRHT